MMSFPQVFLCSFFISLSVAQTVHTCFASIFKIALGVRGKREEHTADAYQPGLITSICLHGHLFYLLGPCCNPRTCPLLNFTQGPLFTSQKLSPCVKTRSSFGCPACVFNSACGFYCLPELDLLTVVVHDPGNRLHCSDTHTLQGKKPNQKKKSLLEITFPLFKMISFHFCA